MKREGFPFFLLLLLILAACGGIDEDRLVAVGDRSLMEAPAWKIEAIPLPVRYEATGTVRSKTRTTLSSKVVGDIRRVVVREGDRVQKGQLLVEIDPRELEASVDSGQAATQEGRQKVAEVEWALQASEEAAQAARANAQLAESTYQRFQSLIQRKSVSLQEFEEVEARHRAAQAELQRALSRVESVRAGWEQARAHLRRAESELESARALASYSTVVSPVDGVVTARQAEPGSLAAPGVPLLTVEETKNYRLEVPVAESQRKLIVPGLQVAVKIGSSNLEIAGKVEEIVPAADPSSRTVLVKISLPSTPSLQTGQYGTAYFPAGVREAIVLPVETLVQKGQLTGVYVLDAGSAARFRLIRTGKSYDQGIEILSGLELGETVVQPVSGLMEGTTVAPLKGEEIGLGVFPAKRNRKDASDEKSRKGEWRLQFPERPAGGAFL